MIHLLNYRIILILMNPLETASLWSILSCLLIVSESLLGIVLWKFKITEIIIIELIALNIGTLLGVTIIEIIPDLYKDVTNKVLNEYVVSMLFLLGILVPFLIEKFIKRGNNSKFKWMKNPIQSIKPKQSIDHENLSSIGDEMKDMRKENIQQHNVEEVKEESKEVDLEAAAQLVSNPRTQIPKENNGMNPNSNELNPVNPSNDNKTNLAKSMASGNTDYSLMFIVLMGDMIHNFVDGAIIAAAYITSTSIGVSTTIGIVLEEIPHLVSTYGIFVYAGASPWKGLLLNILGAIPFFFGASLVLIISSATSVDADQFRYILAFAIGSFMYVSLVDLMPVVTGNWKDYKRSIIQCFVFLLGIGIQVAIKVYDTLENSED